MDKVDFTAVPLLNPSLIPGMKTETKKARGKGESQGSRKALFSSILEDSAQAAGELGAFRELVPSEEALTELMDAVHSAGSDLLERPFADEILRYKKAVRNFVHYVVENGYEMYQTQGIKKKIVIRGKTEWKDAVYNQIRVVDQKLEELAAAILSGQSSQLERISKLDELTGLLVNLTITGAIKERND